MPSGSQAALVSRPARNGDPQPAPGPGESSSIKRDLTSWWRQFGKRTTVKKDEEKGTQVPYQPVYDPVVRGRPVDKPKSRVTGFFKHLFKLG